MRFPAGSRDLSQHQSFSIPALGPSWSLVQLVQVPIPLRVQWLGHEAECSLWSRAKVKKMWIYISTPPVPSLCWKERLYYQFNPVLPLLCYPQVPSITLLFYETQKYFKLLPQNMNVCAVDLHNVLNVLKIKALYLQDLNVFIATILSSSSTHLSTSIPLL